MINDDLSLEAYLATGPKYIYTETAAAVRGLIRNNKKTYLPDKVIRRRLGLTQNQLYHIFNKHPELRAERNSRK